MLITGAAGFLGGYLAEAFRNSGFRLRLFDHAASSSCTFTSDMEYIQGDVRDLAAVSNAVAGVDSVIHAAFASPRQSREVISDVNVKGTKNLCTAALVQGVRRFILISSTITVKPQRLHPFLKNSPLSRFDLYRASRGEAEQIAAECGTHGLSTAVVRPKTFVGPRRVGAFAIIFERIRLGKTIPVLGNGQNRYQLLDIRDMAKGIQLLEAAKDQGAFCFGAENFRTIHEDLQALLDHAQTGSTLYFIPEWIARTILRSLELAGAVPLSEWHYMSAHGEDCVVDLSRAKELGWQASRSNLQALIEAYEWYVTTITTSRSARSTHPVPVTHRMLEKVFGILLK